MLTDFGGINAACPKTYAFILIKFQADRILINHVPFAGGRYKMRRPEDWPSLALDLNSVGFKFLTPASP